MLSLLDDNQSKVIEGFNSISRYLDDILKIASKFFDRIVNHIYLLELQLHKASVSDTDTSFLDLHLFISDGVVKTNFMMTEMI